MTWISLSSSLTDMFIEFSAKKRMDKVVTRRCKGETTFLLEQFLGHC